MAQSRLRRVAAQLLRLPTAVPCEAAIMGPPLEEGWRVVHENTMTSFMEHPEVRRGKEGFQNAIHDTSGGTSYGYKAALVGGVITYGWTIPTIIGALGEQWLQDGWIDVEFRRPIYPDEKLTIRVLAPTEKRTEEAVGGPGIYRLDVTKGGGTDVEHCLTGTLGLGKGPFYGDLQVPADRTPRPRTSVRLDPKIGPTPKEVGPLIGKDLIPRAVKASDASMRQFAEKELGLPASHPIWGAGPKQHLLHPAFLAGQCVQLFIHNVGGYKAGIHTRSQIQNLGRGYASEAGIEVAGRGIDAYERKGHNYVTLDVAIRTPDSGGDIALMRYFEVYQPSPRPAR